MLAGLLIVAMVSGAVAAIAALGLGFPVWAALLAYPLVGTAALILGGVLVTVSGGPRQARTPGFAGVQMQPLRVRLRR